MKLYDFPSKPRMIELSAEDNKLLLSLKASYPNRSEDQILRLAIRLLSTCDEHVRSGGTVLLVLDETAHRLVFHERQEEEDHGRSE